MQSVLLLATAGAIDGPLPKFGDLDDSRRSFASSYKALGSALLVCLTDFKISEFFSCGATFVDVLFLDFLSAFFAFGHIENHFCLGEKNLSA